MNRRGFIQQAAIAGSWAAVGSTVASCATTAKGFADKHFQINMGHYRIPKLRLSMDRIVRETVGLRPFRTIGPRLESEQLGSKTLVHNYGHGGSGWSLSWGSGMLAREEVLKTGVKQVAVIGAGTIGLTTARLLQEKGIEVTIYAKDLAPNVTSSLATGTWSPSSRVCDPQKATPEFKAWWEKATRLSFRAFQFQLGLNDIISWVDEYNVFNEPPAERPNSEIFADLSGLVPERIMLGKKEHPFKADYVSRRSNVMINIPTYLHKHMTDFLLFGGKVKIQEIKKIEDIDALSEKCVVNCMGLGAKAIFNDEHLTPVSGQLSCLIPQPEVTYKLNTKGASIISRKDGIYLGGNGIVGNWDTTPSREQTEKVVAVLQKLMEDMRA